jgi:hypothetical protein
MSCMEKTEWVVSILEMCIKSASHPTVGGSLHMLVPGFNGGTDDSIV